MSPKLLPKEPVTPSWIAHQTLIHDDTSHPGGKFRGVALIRKLLAAQEIDVGRLHHLMPEQRWPVRWSYYVVAPPRALRRSEVKAFRDWILRRVRAYQRAKHGADQATDDALVC